MMREAYLNGAGDTDTVWRERIKTEVDMCCNVLCPHSDHDDTCFKEDVKKRLLEDPK